MPCLCRFDGDVSGFEVAYLAYHDDVRVLAQKRFQCDRKSQAGLVIHVDLIDARQRDFGRVFGGGNVDARLVQQVQAGVQRHGLAGSCGTSDQNHSVGPVDGFEKPPFFFRLVAQRIDPQLGAARIKDTDHNFFAKQRWQGTDTEINDAIRTHLQLHLAVLWHPFFGDIHFGYDLDTRGQLVLDGNRRRSNFAQFPVNPEPYPVGVFIRLEMQV